MQYALRRFLHPLELSMGNKVVYTAEEVHTFFADDLRKAFLAGMAYSAKIATKSTRCPNGCGQRVAERIKDCKKFSD